MLDNPKTTSIMNIEHFKKRVYKQTLSLLDPFSNQKESFVEGEKKMATNKQWAEVGRLVSKLQKVLSRFGEQAAATVTPRKKAKKVAVAAGAGGRRGRKVDPNSKSQMVKAYFDKNGFDHPLKEVAETLTKKHGQEFSIGLVANIKHRLGGTTHRETPKAKAPKAKKTAKAPKAKAVKAPKVKRAKRGQTLWNVLDEILSKNSEGLKLAELTEKVKASNYEYRGKGGEDGLKQNIWQCLNKMKKEGTHKGYEGTEPVVIHDANKRYLINPKASKVA